MKALTLWQPWATLIALGAKRIETRSWPTSFRGELAIHAAVRKPERFNLHSSIRSALRAHGYETIDNAGNPLPGGVIVATCRLVDCVRISAGFPIPEFLKTRSGETFFREVERPFGNYEPGRFAWLLDDVAPLSEPMAARGRQGLWEWTPICPTAERVS